MSRDNLLKWSIIVGTLGLCSGLMHRHALSFPIDHALKPLLIVATLLGVAVYYHRRRVDNFVLCVTSLAHVVAYTTVFSLLMYAVAAEGRPLVDESLIAVDAACGVHLPSIVVWTGEHPLASHCLRLSYDTLLYQTALLVVLLGLSGVRRPLEGFVLQFMLSTLVAAGIFWIWPAAGPFVAYDYPPSDVQALYLEHLHQLRDGLRTVISYEAAEGLITFPSFHTTWAILLVWALRGRGWLTLVIALVNSAVILSTMTTGWHYFADVLGGVGLAIAAIAIVELLQTRWLCAVEASEEPRVLSSLDPACCETSTGPSVGQDTQDAYSPVMPDETSRELVTTATPPVACPPAAQR